MKFRQVATVILAAAGLLAAGSAAAQAYPTRPIRLIVPWTPAGTVDIAARHLAERLAARLGQPVVVENRAGATGQVGSTAVVQAPPDGYTLLAMSATVHTFSPNLARKFPFDPIDDFAVVSQIVSFPYAMVVPANSRFRTVADVSAFAKANPGKVSYASFGLGSGPYMVSELFALSAGVQLLHVPYKGAAPAIIDLLSGQVDFFIDSLPSPLAQVRAGKLRALAVTTPRRSDFLPDVPAMAETIPGFDASVWLGIAASPKTPREIVNRLNAEIRAISAEPAYVERLRSTGLEAAASASPDEFRAFLIAQKKYWGDFVQKAKIPLSD
ncbi:MAG: tripartite tricarboxylate transporter substrate binding protein [Burkholderiales bacterium]|nr:tripartite tricarboxylate transporter substrate binding protein [Burkholderiales bacterium]